MKLFSKLFRQAFQASACILAAAMLTNCSSDEEESSNKDRAQTPEELGEMVFNALKENDREKYENLALFQESDLDAFKKMVEGSSGASEEDKKEVLEWITKDFSKWMKESKESFVHIRKKAKEDGVNWENATFKRVSYEVREKMEDLDLSYIGDLEVTFESGGEEFRFEIEDNLNFTGKFWCKGGDDGMNWRGKVKR